MHRWVVVLQDYRPLSAVEAGTGQEEVFRDRPEERPF